MAKVKFPKVGGGEIEIDTKKIQSLFTLGDTQCKVEYKDGTIHQVDAPMKEVNEVWVEHEA